MKQNEMIEKLNVLVEQLEDFNATLEGFGEAEMTLGELYNEAKGTFVFTVLGDLERAMEKFNETLEYFDEIEWALESVKDAISASIPA